MISEVIEILQPGGYSEGDQSVLFAFYLMQKSYRALNARKLKIVFCNMEIIIETKHLKELFRKP